MEYIKGAERYQKTFLPDCLEDYVGEDNPVRVIDAFVDGLSLNEMGFTHAVIGTTGRPPYDPRDLLKLYIYGYFNRIRSSRKLMQECKRNVEVMFLLGKLIPDFRTIADFRKDNAKALRNVFSEFVKVCLKLELYSKHLLAIDGTKIRAQNSKDNAYNAEILIKKLERIDGHIREYLAELDTNDHSEQRETSLSAAQVKAAVLELKARKAKYQGYLKELSGAGNTQILTTDPDCHRMHTKDGFNCCYNVQTAVDADSHLIAEYEVTGNATDQGLLHKMAEKTKDMLGVQTLEVVADKGYESRRDILTCVMEGTVPNVAFKYDKTERIYALDFEEAEITEEMRQSPLPGNIGTCLHAGVLPACYEGTAIDVELQEKKALGCFTREEDDTVTCPMGQVLHKVKSKGKSSIYANKDACRQCKNRCTSSKNHKTVLFGPDVVRVGVKMYGKQEDVVHAPPTGHVFHNSFYRREHDKKKVLLKIRADKEKLKQRMCSVEHPFGTIKWYDGAHYVLCRGKEKVTAEMGLSFLSYNLKRAINMVGTKKLIEAMGR